MYWVYTVGFFIKLFQLLCHMSKVPKVPKGLLTVDMVLANGRPRRALVIVAVRAGTVPARTGDYQIRAIAPG
jgi:hypothetical protein